MTSSEDKIRAILKSKEVDKVVCYIDIMGMKNKMDDESCDDLKMVYAIQEMIAGNPDVQKDGLFISAFSDCMYIITEQENLDHLFEFVACLAYHLLVKNKTIDEKEEYDCIKIRGGITYGKVLFWDEEEGNEQIPRLDIVSGPAVKRAYILESQKAVYPRVLVDNDLLKLLNKQQYSKFCLLPLSERINDCRYFDFLEYVSVNKEQDMSDINNCIDFVESEMEDALKASDARLAGKLLWYKKYLEGHK